METKQIIESYFKALSHKEGWESYIADKFEFTNVGKTSTSKEEYLTATNRFLRAVQFFEVKQIIIQNDQAAAIVNYKIKSPSGRDGVCEVAEIITTMDGKMNSSRIYFDTAALKEFMAQG